MLQYMYHIFKKYVFYLGSFNDINKNEVGCGSSKLTHWYKCYISNSQQLRSEFVTCSPHLIMVIGTDFSIA